MQIILSINIKEKVLLFLLVHNFNDYRTKFINIIWKYHKAVRN